MPRLLVIPSIVALAAALGAALGAGLGPARAQEPSPGEASPRYLEAIRAELEALRLSPTCEIETATRGRCRWQVVGGRSGRTFGLEVVYDDGTDTAYLFVGRYLEAPRDAATTAALLERMMELNWQLLVGKLEWNPTDGEVRLSAVINTDSNFDRRAFRSTARALGTLADRHHEALRRVLSGP